MVIAFFEIIGGFIRYGFMRIYCKVLGKDYKNLDYYLDDKENEIFRNVNTDYLNGIIGFLTFVFILTLAYFLSK